MQKFLPYVFPTIATVIVLFLAMRWYSQVAQKGQTQPFAADTAISELADSEVQSMLWSNDGVSQVDLEVTQEDSTEPATGNIRYQVEDGMVKMSVMANFNPDSGPYQVWFKDDETDAVRAAFELEYKKGGFLGSASLPADILPFEVLITENTDSASAVSKALLKAVIELPEEEN